MKAIHTSVLLDEAISSLNITKNKKYLDATYGAGGHSKEIIRQGGQVLALDADEDVFKGYEPKDPNAPILIWGNFRNLKEIALHHGFAPVEGIIYDLGLSMMQLASNNKGFSYKYPDAPLLGKINPNDPTPSISEILNSYSLSDLKSILINYGGSLLSENIARAIIQTRKTRPFSKVLHLVELVKSVAPKNQVESELKKIFQSLRIVANDEFNALRESINGVKSILNPGARIAIISFHPDEDRLVKNIFALHKEEFSNVYKKPIKDKTGRRYARSAILRVYQKI